MSVLEQLTLLFAVAVGITVLFNRLRIPSALGYLFVGVLLGPYTIGPVVQTSLITQVAEYGIVFLLFTIGLSFSLPQIKALRQRVLWLGTGQVFITTALVGVIAWLAGLDPVSAFVIGAVFAQSSSTIIAKQLSEQGTLNSPSGRLGLAISVFQDVTAVPFLVIIPLLAVTGSAAVIAGNIGIAMLKVAVTIVVMLLVGGWVLPPAFRYIARLRSTELFTLAVLLTVIAAAWITSSFGLSLAFGAFLAGMALGESEFRHQVEASIRPFRDVLLGMFFISVGMLLDTRVSAQAWLWALAGLIVLVVVKIAVVAVLIRISTADRYLLIRTSLIVAVGGEFGTALLAIALSSAAITSQVAQVGLLTVLMAMVVGTILIMFSDQIACRLTHTATQSARSTDELSPDPGGDLELHNHVIICGYGRIGRSVAALLTSQKLPWVALDLDPDVVRIPHQQDLPVYFADTGDQQALEVLGVERADMLAICHDDVDNALQVIPYVRSVRPDLPILMRTRDDARMAELEQAGVSEVVPETVEAALTLGTEILLKLGVEPAQVMSVIQRERAGHYQLFQSVADDLSPDDEQPSAGPEKDG